MKKKLLMFALLWVVLGAEGQRVIDVSGEGEPFGHYWSVGTCAGRANEGLRTSWVEQLQMVREHCGFQYLRMHGLFDDDMFVYFEDAQGRATYNWQYVDEVYDRMLALGVRPFVELSFFPKGIAADGGKTQMWYGNRVTFDAQRLAKWRQLVEAFARHVVSRYGLEEVRRWYFEVWNEPNLNFADRAGFFDGSRSDYFQLYKASAEAIKGVDAGLRVGGPATSNFIADHRHDGERIDNSRSRFYDQEHINRQQWRGIWIEDFLRFCAEEGLPVDFVSCHAYPTDYALDPVSGRGKDAVRYVHSLRDDLEWLHEAIARSRYPEAEIHITEWSTSPSSRDRMHDLLPPAAYIMKAMLDNVGRAASVMYWTFTDIFEEKGGGASCFHGGFGMVSFQGIVKPSFHAYRMLHQQGDRRLYYSSASGASLFVSRDSRSGLVSAVAFNYPEEYEQRVPSAADAGRFMQASAKTLNCTLAGLPPEAEFAVETLDYDHGNVYPLWQQMGAPSSPSREETQLLRSLAWQTRRDTLRADGEGRLPVSMTLQPWTCVLLKQIVAQEFDVFIPVSEAQERMATGPFEPTWESLSKHETPEWFRDAKFGIWAHWGPQCVEGSGDWMARNMYHEGSREYQFHRDHYGHQSEVGFKDILPLFRAERWQPDSLVAYYKRVGARYFFALGNHHDNFDLWDSQYQPWNSVNIGPKRDILAEWKAAADRAGLPLGVSFHADHAWRWYESAQKCDTTGELKGIPYDGTLTAADGKGKWWDGLDPQQLYAQQHPLSKGSIHDQWDWTHGAVLPSEAFITNFYNRTLDAINRYRPALIYFDVTVLPFYGLSDCGLRIAAHEYNIGKEGSVVFGKILKEDQRQALTWDVERGAPNAIQPEPWQTCTCLGGWHWNEGISRGNHYKKAPQVVKFLVDVVSKNGNLLLSVPLRADGTFDEHEHEILEGIRAWMDQNGECIYKTRPWVRFGEGPLAESDIKINAQGFNEGSYAQMGSEEIRFTETPEALYAIVMGWPENSEVVIRSLRKGNPDFTRKIKHVDLLGYGRLKARQTADGLAVTLPAQPVNAIAPVLRIRK